MIFKFNRSIRFLKRKMRSLKGNPQSGKNKGFSLIETVIAIALVGIALIGLAQLFMVSVMNNARSDRITNSTFLAQQQIDFLRNQSSTDLDTLAASPIDEQIDVNNDGTLDFRRVTRIQISGYYWGVRIQVFPASQLYAELDDLINYPNKHHVRADMATIISR